MWDIGWDKIFKDNEWGKYPGEELIRFIARKYFNKKDRKTIKILELGCGAGANIWFLSREGFDVYGVDGSKYALNQAKKLLKNDSLKAKLQQSDVANLTFPDNMFDCVIDVECIYANSLADTKIILQEANRVLKPSGWFYSKTFSVGMTGESTGSKYKNELNTYTTMKDSPLRSEYSLIRLTSEKEISKIYSIFSNLEYDFIHRSDKNRKFEIKEWIITAQKKVC